MLIREVFNVKTEEIFEKIDELEQEYINFWVDICNIESPTNFKEGVDAVGKFISGKAKELGWEVEVSHQEVSGDAVCITMNGDSKEKPIVLSGHMDTVHPVGSFGTPTSRIEDDKLFAPGAEDCKGGITAAFFSMAVLEKCGFRKRPVKLVLQSDEEVGSVTSNKKTVEFMAEKAKGCEAFLNCEGYWPHMVVIERKGILRYSIEVNGKAMHSAACYNGASAVCEAAHKIIELEKWKDGNGITCNCSVISGGSTPNTVPDKCSFIADFRYKKKEEMAVIEQFVKELCEKSTIEGTTASYKVKSYRYAMERVERNEKLVERINEIFERNGIPRVKPTANNGGSDAADMTSAGITCVDSFGVVGGGIHSVGEYAFISSLKEAVKRIVAVVNEL